MMRADRLMKETLVIKVGTSTLLSRDEIPSMSFRYIADSIRGLSDRYNIVLVTSGAIGFGVTRLGLDSRPTDLAKLQALSMIGQVGLLKSWREALEGISIGQVLVTRRDLERESTAGLFCDSVKALWSFGALPIVNENDAISNDEISFGDNDQLASEVAVVMRASKLVFLTDQDGIQANYGTSEQHRLEVVSIVEASRHLMPTKSSLGKGGASSKVQSARIALAEGIEVYVAQASDEHSVEDALAGKVGTKVVQ